MVEKDQYLNKLRSAEEAGSHHTWGQAQLSLKGHGDWKKLLRRRKQTEESKCPSYLWKREGSRELQISQPHLHPWEDDGIFWTD